MDSVRDAKGRGPLDLTQLEGHTPGPWAIRNPDLNIVGPPENASPAVLSHLADVRGYVGQNEAHANARLIAAAPDLLAEVRKLRAQRDRLRELFYLVARFADPDEQSGEDLWESLECVRDIARNALAEGGAA